MNIIQLILTNFNPYHEIYCIAYFQASLPRTQFTRLRSRLHNVAFCDSSTLQYVLDTAQRIIDNSLGSGIIASIRNSISRLISGWVVKCVRQKVAVVPSMLSSAHIDM